MMEDVEVYLLARLNSSPAIQALGISISPAMSSEQKPLPRVVYSRVSGAPTTHHGGEGGLSYYRIQFDVFALTAASRSEVGEAIRARLSGFRGNVTVNAVDRFFGIIKLEDARDQHTPPIDGSDKPTYRRTLDFTVGTQEPVPDLTA